jgi:hypothetical protein
MKTEKNVYKNCRNAQNVITPAYHQFPMKHFFAFSRKITFPIHENTARSGILNFHLFITFAHQKFAYPRERNFTDLSPQKLLIMTTHIRKIAEIPLSRIDSNATPLICYFLRGSKNIRKMENREYFSRHFQNNNQRAMENLFSQIQPAFCAFI